MKIKINALDILICLAVVGVALAASMYLSGGSIMASNSKTVYFTVEITTLPQGFSEKISIGDIIEDSDKGHYYGTVYDIKVEQTRVETLDAANHRIVRAPVPERETLYLTVKCDGTESDTTITAGGQVMSIGRRMNIKGKGYAVGGFISALSTE